MRERAIVGFHRDEHGDWVAELACGHQRHVRHRPPFQVAPWVVDEEGRRARVGTLLECGRCAAESSSAAGGEAPCLFPSACPDCGAVLDGGGHRDGCGVAVDPPAGR